MLYGTIAMGQSMWQFWRLYVHPLQRHEMQKLSMLGLGSSKIISNIAIWYSTYDVLFNFASIVYRFRVIVGYFSKVAYFNLPQLHRCPWCWWPCANLDKIFVIRKVKLSSQAFVRCSLRDPRVSLAILIQCWSVTDAHTETDTQTDRCMTTAYTAIP